MNEEREMKVLKKSVVERLNSFFIECFIHLKAPRWGKKKTEGHYILVQLHKMIGRL